MSDLERWRDRAVEALTEAANTRDEGEDADVRIVELVRIGIAVHVRAGGAVQRWQGLRWSELLSWLPRTID
jgi:hypothetical protein